MDRQEQIKETIDQVQPSYERKLALLFLLAMPKTTEKRIVASVKETMSKHKVTDRELMRLGMVIGLLTASLREATRQATNSDPTHDLADMDISEIITGRKH